MLDEKRFEPPSRKQRKDERMEGRPNIEALKAVALSGGELTDAHFSVLEACEYVERLEQQAKDLRAMASALADQWRPDGDQYVRTNDLEPQRGSQNFMILQRIHSLQNDDWRDARRPLIDLQVELREARELAETRQVRCEAALRERDDAVRDAVREVEALQNRLLELEAVEEQRVVDGAGLSELRKQRDSESDEQAAERRTAYADREASRLWARMTLSSLTAAIKRAMEVEAFEGVAEYSAQGDPPPLVMEFVRKAYAELVKGLGGEKRTADEVSEGLRFREVIAIRFAGCKTPEDAIVSIDALRARVDELETENEQLRQVHDGPEGERTWTCPKHGELHSPNCMECGAEAAGHGGDES